MSDILPAKAARVCATVVGLDSVLANFAAGKRMYLLIALAGTYLAAPIVGYDTADLPAGRKSKGVLIRRAWWASAASSARAYCSSVAAGSSRRCRRGGTPTKRTTAHLAAQTE